MQFSQWGEDSFIAYLSQHFPPPKDIHGIGDDAAVIPDETKGFSLITSDSLIEGVHFLREQISAHDLGFKTIAVNVSDIAAKGGFPKYAFFTIALPPTIACEWVKELIQGLKEACQKWSIVLLGGDTVGSKRDIFLSITLTGHAEAVKYRSGARIGDAIYVSETLGDVAMRLKQPIPSPEMGQWLSQKENVHAMMDISDGLDCDLRRMLKASQKGAIVRIESIPLSDDLKKMGGDVLEKALAGGEDYCLLITMNAGEETSEAFQKKFGKPLYKIGEIVAGKDLTYLDKEKIFSYPYKNWDHFSS